MFDGSYQETPEPVLDRYSPTIKAVVYSGAMLIIGVFWYYVGHALWPLIRG